MSEPHHGNLKIPVIRWGVPALPQRHVKSLHCSVTTPCRCSDVRNACLEVLIGHSTLWYIPLEVLVQRTFSPMSFPWASRAVVITACMSHNSLLAGQLCGLAVIMTATSVSLPEEARKVWHLRYEAHISGTELLTSSPITDW